jgi:predicted NBD/HSP70 family sugar kinase
MVRFVIDGGGTNLRVECIDEDGRTSRRTVRTDTANYVLSRNALFAAIHALRGNAPIEGIAFSVAGSTEDGVITACANLKGWVGRTIVDDLHVHYGCPVWLFSDGQAMGASEYSVQEQPLILGILGSGVNFCLVLGADILTPDTTGPSIIGEGGHQQIVRDGRLCNCGRRGCLEAYIGGLATEKYHGPPETRSDEAWDEILGYLAQGLHNVIALTGGKLPIFFSGGVACKQEKRLLSELPALLEPTRMIVPDLPSIAIATYREDAGIHGAGRILAQQLTS